MKDSLKNQNSFMFDRNWQKINPNNELVVSIEQAKLFLKLLVLQHQKLKRIGEVNFEQVNEQKIEEKIMSFIFKFIQQRQISLTAKRQFPTLQKSPYKLDLNDCLEIWRWLSQDSVSYKTKQINYDDSMDINEFQLGKNFQSIQIKKNVDYGYKNKRIFAELSLQQQQSVLKKSLEMVHMYYHQFKIIFNHYCRFVIQNQHKKTFTFDDVTNSLEQLTINRFMLFCREFDIIKTLQFKKKTQHNASMSKSSLLKIFNKASYLQKYMSFDNFLMSLVNISLKIHQNFDPRSYMHIQLFLNNLKVKYYQQFVKKLQSLKIKYSQTQFYNCYKHIFNKEMIKKKKQSKGSIFTNPHFAKQQLTSRVTQNEDLLVNESIKLKNYNLQSKLRSYKSVPSLAKQQFRNNESTMKKSTKTLQKRKISVPALPSLQQNRYFKPIQPNYHRSVYNKYLQNVEQTSSVFKNRITGYSNINNLKSKGFHMNENPQTLSKEKFQSLIIKKKQSISNIQDKGLEGNNSLTYSQIITPERNNQQQQIKQYKNSKIQQKAHLIENKSEIINQIKINMQNDTINIEEVPKIDQKIDHIIQPKSQTQVQVKPITLDTSNLLQKQQKKQVLQTLKHKIDVRDDDQLLNKHLIAQQRKQKEVNTKIIEVFKKYNFDS